ncbi:hypothetical protein BGX28_003867 [Mortierella sp. GBA30]|nr:hypothetical protein BGX28_003867 [Mortierella sp. GBA30]
MSAYYYSTKASPAINISCTTKNNRPPNPDESCLNVEKPFVPSLVSLLGTSPAFPTDTSSATAADALSSHLPYYPSSYSSTSSWHPMDVSSSSFRFDGDFERQHSPSFAADNIHAREFETAFCRDFYCCGLRLCDLHDLLQHYEECHVRFEEEEDDDFVENDSDFFDEDGWSDSDSAPSSPSSTTPGSGLAFAGVSAGGGSNLGAAAGHHFHPSQPYGQRTSHSLLQQPLIHPTHPLYRHPSDSISSSDIDSTARNSTIYALDAFAASLGGSSKRKAVVSMADIYSEDDSDISGDRSSAFSNGILRPRTNASLTARLDLFGTLAKRQAVESDQSGGGALGSQQDPTPNSLLHTNSATRIGPLSTRHAFEMSNSPYVAAAVDLMRQRDEVFSLMEDITRNGNANTGDKPYRCTVLGCDKAYKNPNGLKYHNIHGHCSSGGMSETDSPETKPYVCTFLECGKRYKNLNGLKYHIEHSHPNLTAALRAHQSGLVNPAIFGPYPSQAAMTIAAALQAVNSSPMMMAAANAIMTAQAANAANAAANAANTNLNGGLPPGPPPGPGAGPSGTAFGSGPSPYAAPHFCTSGSISDSEPSIGQEMGSTGPPGLGTGPRSGPLRIDSKFDGSSETKESGESMAPCVYIGSAIPQLPMTASAVPMQSDD